MYYPKSHITPNLYSNGELAYKDSLSSYVGYYFSTFDGKNFTGRFPGDGENLELIPTPTKTYPDSEFFEGNNPEDTRLYTPNSVYSRLNNVTYGKGLTQTPTQYYPKPTSDDYQLGEFTRYFAKKANEEIYYETSDLFQNSLYIGFSLPWAISGDRAKVQRVNKNIVALKEQQYSIKGLGVYLRFNYLEFYR